MLVYGFRITGANSHYGTPTNPAMPSYIPGGASSGSAVAVAAELVDFAIGMVLSHVDENIHKRNKQALIVI